MCQCVCMNVCMQQILFIKYKLFLSVHVGMYACKHAGMQANGMYTYMHAHKHTCTYMYKTHVHRHACARTHIMYT